MANRYWIGNTGILATNGRFAATPGASFRITSYSNPTLTYTDLIGTIANGQSVYINATSSADSNYVGTISNLNTTNKTFQVSGGSFSFPANYGIWTSGVLSSTTSLTTDSIIIDHRSGSGKVRAASFAYYNSIDFTGYTGTLTEAINVKNLVLNPVMLFEMSGNDAIYIYGSPSSLGFVSGNYELEESGYPTNLIIGQDLNNNTQTTTLNITSPLESLTNSSKFSALFTNGTINTNNHSLKVAQLYLDNVIHNANSTIVFNAGTSNIYCNEFFTGTNYPYYSYSLTITGNWTLNTSWIDHKLPVSLYNVNFINQDSNYIYHSFTCNLLTCSDAATLEAILIEPSIEISANNFTFTNVENITGYGYLTLTKTAVGTSTFKNCGISGVIAQPINTFYASNCENLGDNININFSTNSIMTFF